MIVRNNRGEVIAEMNVTLTQDGGLIKTNTMYDRGRPVTQHISIKDNQGKVRCETVFGKLLP